MPTKLQELHVDKKLIDPNFEGYKLSLDEIPGKSFKLSVSVHELKHENHFSYLYWSLLSLQNHLTVDPWNVNALYYINKNLSIARIILRSIDGEIEDILQLLSIPQGSNEKLLYRYNACLLFAGPKIAVIANGCGSLDIVNTGIRSEKQEWSSEYSSYVFGEDYSFTILDALCVEEANETKLHCLLTAITDEKEPAKTSTVSRAFTDLRWVVFKKTNDSWDLESTLEARSKGAVKYAYFSPQCEFLLIESTKPIELPKEAKLDNGVEKKSILYYWQQLTDDIKVWFAVPAGCVQDDVKITISDNRLSINVKKETFLEGNIFQRLNSDLTTCSVADNRVEIILKKTEKGQMWSYLIENDDHGMEIVDPSLVQEVHERLSHLCSDTEDKNITGNSAPVFNLDQLEACDAVTDEDSLLIAIDASTKKITHEVDVSGHQKLFNLRVGSNEAPYLCVRHDVDGTLWQLDAHRDELCKHVGTLNAFGYVLASKQWKYATCSPDLGYAVIVPTKQNVFVYKQNCTVSTQLKNRKTGHSYSQIGKQYLINLASTDEIVGLHASNNFLIVLTVNTFFVYRMSDVV